MCDPDCLCVIFSFIRDEQPKVRLAGAARLSAQACVSVCACARVWCVCVKSGGGRWVREGGGSTAINRIMADIH